MRFLVTLVFMCLAMPVWAASSSFCTPRKDPTQECINKDCDPTHLGETTVDTGAKNIVACLNDGAGGTVWKSMSQTQTKSYNYKMCAGTIDVGFNNSYAESNQITSAMPPDCSVCKNARIFTQSMRESIDCYPGPGTNCNNDPGTTTTDLRSFGFLIYPGGVVPNALSFNGVTSGYVATPGSLPVGFGVMVSSNNSVYMPGATSYPVGVHYLIICDPD